MKISVFGLGYVGIISAACLAEQGYKVLGVEVSSDKIEQVNRGVSPIVEPYVNEVVKKVTASGNLCAISDIKKGIMETDISLICVGTPSKDTGEVDLSYIFKTAEEIGEVLKEKQTYHIILIRSTSMPGTVDKYAEILESKSDKRRKKDFDVVANPEFLREGNAMNDFYNPPFTLLGCECESSEKTIRKMYSFLECPFIITSIRTAEMLKYVNNTFHALKVDFANEISRFCKKKNIDSREVIDIFVLDRKLNISEYYLRPGFAFGGSCLPKDVRALAYEAKKIGVNIPVVENIMNSNELHIEWAFQTIIKEKASKVGIFGISFKNGTDDLRESPAVLLVEMLLGKGKDVYIYDENVHVANLMGTNKDYIEREIKHISTLIESDAVKMIEKVDILVIANKDNSYREIINNYNGKEVIIIDLVNLFPEKKSGKNYRGIGW
ncbi:MAG: nucleotide sugar dehydrogenase [bacterium]